MQAHWRHGVRIRLRAASYMLPTVAQGVIPLVTLPIFSRMLSREEYGIWGICTAAASMASGIASLGLLIGYERNFFETTDERSKARLLYSVVAFAFLSQAIGFMVTLLLAPVAAQRLLGAPQLAHLFVLAYCAMAVPSLKTYFMVLLRNENRAREYLHFSVDELVLGAILSVIAVVWMRWGVAGLLAGPLAASTIVLSIVVARSCSTLRPAFGRRELNDTLRISLPLAPRVLIGALGNQLDRLVLGAFGSLAAVGLYTIGQRVASIVFAFMTSLQNVYQPTVYRMLFAGGEDTPRHLGVFLAPFAYASVGAALAVVLFPGEILRLVAAPEYFAAAPVLTLLAINYAFMFFGKQPQLTFARKTGLISVISMFSVFLNALCVYVGARTGGAVGAAGGLLVANVSTNAVNLWLAQRFAPIAYPVVQTAMVFGVLPLAALTSMLLQTAGTPDIIVWIVRILILAAFLSSGWRAGLFSGLWNSVGRSVATP